MTLTSMMTVSNITAAQSLALRHSLRSSTLHLGCRRQVERAPRISLLPQQRHHRLLCHRSKVVMFTPRFPAIVLPLGGPGEATRKAPEVDIQLVLPSFGWGRDGELLRVGRELQGERGREAQRGSAAGSYCAAGLKTH